jgi:hypothetical protein
MSCDKIKMFHIAHRRKDRTNASASLAFYRRLKTDQCSVLFRIGTVSLCIVGQAVIVWRVAEDILVTTQGSFIPPLGLAVDRRAATTENHGNKERKE